MACRLTLHMGQATFERLPALLLTVQQSMCQDCCLFLRTAWPLFKQMNAQYRLQRMTASTLLGQLHCMPPKGAHSLATARVGF